MTFTAIKSTGEGRISLRLVVEGSVVQWVTSPAMVQQLSDGRVRLDGLKVDGITLDEIVDFAKAKITLKPFEAKIVDTPIDGLLDTGHGPVLPGSFVFGGGAQKTTYFSPGAPYYVTDVDASIPVQSTAGFASSGQIWLNRECITYTSVDATHFLGCTRGAWDTAAQYHYGPDGATSGLVLPEVTDRPVIFEQRRAYLFIYGDGDNPQGDGTQIWQGTLAREPRMTDAITWSLSVNPITMTWAQDVGADLKDAFAPRGAYYPFDSCFFIRLWRSSNQLASNIGTPVDIKVTGFAEDNTGVATLINNAIAASTASGYGVTCRADAATGIAFELLTGAGGANRFVGLWAFSRVDGTHGNMGIFPGGPTFPLRKSTDGTADMSTVGPTAATSASTLYGFPVSASPAELIHGRVAAPGFCPRGGVVTAAGYGHGYRYPDGSFHPGDTRIDLLTDTTAQATYPSNRIYLSHGVSATGLTSVFCSWETGDPPVQENVTVINSDAGENWIEVDNGTLVRDFAGAADLPSFRGARVYGTGINLKGLRDVMIADSPAGSATGATPEIRSTDFGSWAIADTVGGSGATVQQRAYVVLQPIKLEDLFAGEAQLLGCYFGLDVNGRVELRQVGVPTSYTPTAIDATAELTSKAWSTWERNARGAVNEVVIRTGYDPMDNDWKGQPIVERNIASFGRNPIPAPVEIKPYSNPSGAGFVVLGSFGPTVGVADYTRLAQNLLAVYGYPSITITVCVPFTKFDVLTGQLVQLTSVTLPDGTYGQRGLVGRSGIVIGRRWNLEEGVGYLTVLITEANVAGYTPATRISAISLVGGTTYDLTIDPSNPTGYADAAFWSAIETLAAGNDVTCRWRQWNTTSVAANVSGRFIGVVAGKLRATFTGAISLAAGTFNFCFDTPAGSPIGSPDEASQRIYTYLASSAGRIDWNDGTTSRARVEAP